MSICVLAATLLAVPAISAAKPAARSHAKSTAKVSGGQTYARGHCRVTVPKSWADYHGGKADPRDRSFGVTLGRASDPKAMAATVKAMHGRTLSDESSLTLMLVHLRGRDARQYWAMTKPGPGCRATVTFSESGQEAAAKKIARSLKKAS